MNVISFSLWGNDPLYNIGAIKNADLAAKIYPDWICYYYCSKCVPEQTIEKLKERNNVKIISTNIENCGQFIECTNQRLFAIDLPDVKYVIFRDADSRISNREKIAVDEWIDGGYDIHIMRDHPYHGWFVQNGMFGLKCDKFKNEIRNVLDNYNFNDIKGEDQTCMSAYLKHKIISDQCSYIEHDPFFAKKPFPGKAKRGSENGGVYFVGQRILVENGEDIYHSPLYDNDINEIVKVENS